MIIFTTLSKINTDFKRLVYDSFSVHNDELFLEISEASDDKEATMLKKTIELHCSEF
jgi:hypothetical protein